MLKVTDRASNAELEAHRPGFAVFDVGSRSIFVRNRLVDWAFVLAVLVAVLLSLYLVVSGLEFVVRWLSGMAADRLGLASVALASPSSVVKRGLSGP